MSTDIWAMSTDTPSRDLAVGPLRGGTVTPISEPLAACSLNDGSQKTQHPPVKSVTGQSTTMRTTRKEVNAFNGDSEDDETARVLPSWSKNVVGLWDGCGGYEAQGGEGTERVCTDNRRHGSAVGLPCSIRARRYSLVNRIASYIHLRSPRAYGMTSGTFTLLSMPSHRIRLSARV